MVLVKQFSNRKGQVAEAPSGASGAAFLILLITIVIVFYILFLPPSDRAALLDSDGIPGTAPTISGGYAHLVGSTPLSEAIGELTYIRESTIERDLASFIIYTQTDANIIATAPAVQVTNSAYDNKGFSLPFALDPRVTENVFVSFNVDAADGNLEIYLNGEQLFDAPVTQTNPQPIELPANLLKRENILYFAVSSPGFAFWTMNRYDISNVQIVGDITDDSNSAHRQTIFISETEKEHAESVTLEFYPDCEAGDVGALQASLNGQQLFNGLPDCNLINFVDIDPSLLVQGTNTLSFSSNMGSYVVDQVQLEVTLDNPGYPVYYFNLNEDLFVTKQTGDRFCGNVDGFCPEGCEAYEDKDCCFDESSQNYWCDVRTNNVRDRCVNQVLASYANNCPSGYEDRTGDIHEDFQGKCGDDDDGFCPTGCSADYDKDCCYGQTGTNYWCDDVPLTGVANVCTQAVSIAECNACPDGYRDEDNDQPNCPARQVVQFLEEEELKSGVDIVLESYFTNQDYKQVDFVVNGYSIPVDTYNVQVYRNINSYVHEGTNSLEIRPRRDVSISQVRVVVE